MNFKTLFLLTLCLTSCSRARQTAALATLHNGAENDAATEYKEAWITFPGHEALWAGAKSFKLHLKLDTDSDKTQATLTPAIASLFTEFPNERVPASNAPLKPQNNELIREKLQELGDALSHAEESHASYEKTGEHGTQPGTPCAHPIHVRLVRMDGSLLEKQGCRNMRGWPRTASEIVHEILSAQSGG